jgi:hypothetical protein
MAALETNTGKSVRGKRSTRRQMATRDARIIERLVAGVTIHEIALSEGITPRLARERMAAILARRTLDTPGEFLQMQIRRMSEAMLVAYSAMSGGNLRAVDRYVRIVRELDRYHSSAFALRPASALPLASRQPPTLLPAPICEPTPNGAVSD